jgi:hypothetical protein
MGHAGSLSNHSSKSRTKNPNGGRDPMVLGIRGLIKLERIEQLGLTAISFPTKPIFAIVPRELINSGACLYLRTFIRGRYDYEVELQSRYD